MPGLQHNKLIVFLLFSLLVHAVVLALYVPRHEALRVHVGNPLTLSLVQQASKPTSKPAQKPVQKKAPAPEQKPLIRTRTHTRQTKANPARPITRTQVATFQRVRTLAVQKNATATEPPFIRQAVQKPEARPITASMENSESRARMQRLIQQKLTARLAFYHHYPQLAVRNQWQGKVNLGLRIEANGQLSNVHVVQSSGYSILDTAAINSLQRVATLPEVEGWLKGGHLDMVLPVIYRLIDG